MNRNRASLDEVFSPRSAAIVGASPDPGFPNMMIRSLLESQFPAIYPVNPKYSDVLGLKCYSTLRDIPGQVDCAVVGIAAGGILSLLDECAEKGVKAIHLFTAGFSETGHSERAELEQTILATAQSLGIRIVGPNCVGIFSPGSRFSNALGIPVRKGPISFLSQSGSHTEYILTEGTPRGLSFSKVINHGNALDIDECEILEYFAADTDTGIIAGYIEGVRDGRGFLKIAKAAGALKPVVLFKAGATKAGRRTTRTHTASLAGDFSLFDSVCKQGNIIRADSIEELVDILVTLSYMSPLPEGSSVGILGRGGGPSVIAGEEMERAGIDVPVLPEATLRELEQLISPAGNILANPVDARETGDPAQMEKILQVVANAPNIHFLHLHFGFSQLTRWGCGIGRITRTPEQLQHTIAVFGRVRQLSGKPIVLTLCPPTDVCGMEEFMKVREACVEANIPVYNSMQSTARAIGKVIGWHQRRLN